MRLNTRERCSLGPFIIAEAGVNHNGNRDLALELVNVAAASGADAVKFQTFRTEALVTRSADKAAYQEHNTSNSKSQFNMLKGLELSEELHYELVAECQEHRILFLSTAFDPSSLNFLIAKLNVPILKIGSGELTNGPFLLAHAKSKKPIILSTGMATLNEIEEALGVLAFGYTSTKKPNLSLFRRAYESSEGQRALKENVTLLHCTTNYPTENNQVHLRAMRTMADQFGLSVGLSDHSRGILAPSLATAMGAVVIEKHLTLDKNLPGPDHNASLEPNELKEMVKQIRTTNMMMGKKEKQPTEAELENVKAARKSLVAARDISVGEAYTTTNVVVKRPGCGLSPMKYWEILGKKSTCSYREDEVIERI